MRKDVHTVSVDSQLISELNSDDLVPSPEDLMIAAEDMAEQSGNSAADEWTWLTGLIHARH